MEPPFGFGIVMGDEMSDACGRRVQVQRRPMERQSGFRTPKCCFALRPLVVLLQFGFLPKQAK